VPISSLRSRPAVIGAVVVAVIAAGVVVNRVTAPDAVSAVAAAPSGPGTEFDLVTPGEAAATAPGADAGGGGTASAGRAVRGAGKGAPRASGAKAQASHIALPGVTDKEITLAYYWKGDRTRTSPYLAGSSGARANVDEGEAFRTLVAYVNRHGKGGATLMGYPFNLHGRKIKPVVLEAGNSPEDYGATVDKLIDTVKPMAAIAAHGSLSAYTCQRLAKAGIHNLATFAVAPNMEGRSNGYCRPGGLTWEGQVDASVAELRRLPGSPVVGVVWSEYPGLVDSAPAFVARLRAAGVKVGATATLPADLTAAQQQATTAVARMQDGDVTRVVFPDGGAPLSFTQAAEAAQYRPDYFVWPCSGQDLPAMVRLFNPAQWARASGITCYDQSWAVDLAHDDASRRTEWFRQYQTVSGNDVEPPATTGLIYQSLLPLLVGITEAGPALDLESFRDGLATEAPYRYDASKGRVTDMRSMLVSPAGGAPGFYADVVPVTWNAARQASGNALVGTYVYEDKRVAPGG